MGIRGGAHADCSVRPQALAMPAISPRLVAEGAMRASRAACSPFVEDRRMQNERPACSLVATALIATAP